MFMTVISRRSHIHKLIIKLDLQEGARLHLNKAHTSMYTWYNGPINLIEWLWYKMAAIYIVYLRHDIDLIKKLIKSIKMLGNMRCRKEGSEREISRDFYFQ